MDNPEGRFTLVYLAAAGDEKAQLELTYNYGTTTMMTVARAILGMWPMRSTTSTCSVSA